MNKYLIEDFEKVLNLIKINRLKKKNILITGPTSFISNYIINFFIFLNESYNFDVNIYLLSHNIKKAKEKIKFSKKKYISLQQWNKNKKINLDRISYIFHIASPASPSDFYNKPFSVIEANIELTQYLLSNINKSNNLKKFFYFSSTGVYGHLEDSSRPNDESTFGYLDPLLPESIYLESKRMAETICLQYSKARNIPINILRLSICYGPGINIEDSRSYSSFIQSIIKKRDIKLFTKGLVYRNFCYILDILYGICILINKKEKFNVYNLTSDKEIRIKDLAKLLLHDVFRQRKLKISYVSSKEKYFRTEFTKTTVSNNKIKKLGWKEITSLKDGFKRTVGFYENS